MAAPKGNKYAGSRKGVPNKRTEQWAMFTTFCLEGGLDRFEIEIKKLKGKQYVDAFLNLLEYHKPKLSRTELKQDGLNEMIIKIILS